MNQTQFKKNIQLVNLYKMIIPALFLLILIIITFHIPIINCIFPTSFVASDLPSDIYSSSTHYVNCTIDKLYYTGYDYTKSSSVRGHYYYSLENEKCTIYLISSSYLKNYSANAIAGDTTDDLTIDCTDDSVNSIKNTPELLENVSFNAKLISHPDAIDALLTLMARDLNWTYYDLASRSDSLIVSQLNYMVMPSVMIGCVLIFVFALIIGYLLILCYNIIFPESAYTFRNLGHFKERKSMIIAASTELANSLHFRREGMYVTDHYFVYVSRFNFIILPLKSMAWSYSYKHNNPFRFKRDSNYTIKIITKKKAKFHFSWKSEDTATIFLCYLKQNNPNMLIGYSHKNKTVINRA